MPTAAGQHQVPIVSYLVLGDDPHLLVTTCINCGAGFFDRRLFCANCGAGDFKKTRLPNTGRLQTFTIIGVGPPGVTTPFVAGIVNCGGVHVRTNIVGVEPSPDEVIVGMEVALTTFSLGRDAAGTEAVGFGFMPASGGGQDV